MSKAASLWFLILINNFLLALDLDIGIIILDKNERYLVPRYDQSANQPHQIFLTELTGSNEGFFTKKFLKSKVSFEDYKLFEGQTTLIKNTQKSDLIVKKLHRIPTIHNPHNIKVISSTALMLRAPLMYTIGVREDKVGEIELTKVSKTGFKCHLWLYTDKKQVEIAEKIFMNQWVVIDSADIQIFMKVKNRE